MCTISGRYCFFFFARGHPLYGLLQDPTGTNLRTRSRKGRTFSAHLRFKSTKVSDYVCFVVFAVRRIGRVTAPQCNDLIGATDPGEPIAENCQALLGCESSRLPCFNTSNYDSVRTFFFFFTVSVNEMWVKRLLGPAHDSSLCNAVLRPECSRQSCGLATIRFPDSIAVRELSSTVK